MSLNTGRMRRWMQHWPSLKRHCRAWLGVIADAYIECIDIEGIELPGVGGAVSGSGELEELCDETDVAFSARCRYRSGAGTQPD